MVDILTQNEELLALASAWEEHAEVLEHWRPGGDDARMLRQCAESLRRRLDQTAPDEVTLPVIRDRTGWSLGWLQERAQVLSEAGHARKGPDGTWRVDRKAALRIPVKRGHRPALEEMGSLEEMADHILDLQTT